MALVPFRRDLDRLFRSGQRVGWKVLAGALVGGAVGIGVAAESIKSSPSVAIIVACGTVVLGALVAFGLCMRDQVECQRTAGEPVSTLARILFGSRFKSLAIWCAIITFAIMLAVFAHALATKR
ncbi:MAG: hypothetical protein WD768_15160 [Phycisphaeraceae bacterium]